MLSPAMPTKYDVFAQIIEHAPCKAKDLKFKTAIYAHIRYLIDAGWIKKSGNAYVPINNKTTLPLFKIIKYFLEKYVPCSERVIVMCP